MILRESKEFHICTVKFHFIIIAEWNQVVVFIHFAYAQWISYELQFTRRTFKTICLFLDNEWYASNFTLLLIYLIYELLFNIRKNLIYFKHLQWCEQIRSLELKTFTTPFLTFTIEIAYLCNITSKLNQLKTLYDFYISNKR